MNRAHFGAWAVSSSPLIIGADISNETLLETIMPIIGNTEVRRTIATTATATTTPFIIHMIGMHQLHENPWRHAH